MSNSTGRRLRLVPVTIPLGPLPPRPRSVAALDLRGYRLISIASSSRHRRLRHLSAPPPSRVQTRSSIPRLPSILPPLLSLQLGRLQTCPSYPFPWCPNQTWLQNIVHRPNSSDGLVVPYSPIAPPRHSRVCTAHSNTNHPRVTGTLHGAHPELTLRWMIPSHLMV